MQILLIGLKLDVERFNTFCVYRYVEKLEILKPRLK